MGSPVSVKLCGGLHGTVLVSLYVSHRHSDGLEQRFFTLVGH